MASILIERYRYYSYKVRVLCYFLTARNRGDFYHHECLLTQSNTLTRDQQAHRRIQLRIDIKNEIQRKLYRLLIARNALSKIQHPLTTHVIQQYIQRSSHTLRCYRDLYHWIKNNSVTPYDQPKFIKHQLLSPVGWPYKLLHSNFTHASIIYLLYLAPCLLLTRKLTLNHYAAWLATLILIFTYCLLAIIGKCFKRRLMKSFYLPPHTQ